MLQSCSPGMKPGGCDDGDGTKRNRPGTTILCHYIAHEYCLDNNNNRDWQKIKNRFTKFMMVHVDCMYNR